MLRIILSILLTAFIFINVETGTDQDVVKVLQKVPYITEVFEVYGVYDVVAKVEADDLIKLNEVMMDHIRHIANVKNTVTLIAIKR